MSFKSTSLMFWLLGLSINVSAQEIPFIQPVTNLDLNPQQSAKLSALRNLPTTQDIQLVRVNTTPMKSADALPVTIKQVSFSIKESSRDFGDDNVGSWSGTAPRAADDSTLMVVNGANVTASIQAADGLYRIQPLGNGLHAYVKVDTRKFPREHPPSFNENRDLQDIPPFPRKLESDKSITTISVLVAYTPAVQNKVADVPSLVQLAFNEANQSYKNSNIHINLVPALADPVLVSYTETGSQDTALREFINMADVRRLRESNKANVAVLFVDDGEACGVARRILATRDSAFVVVYYNCATGYYSFAHEIGHLQGARHNPEEDKSALPFPYGHGFMDLKRKRRTIMSYDCAAGCKRELQWARPPNWGNTGRSYDSKVLNETAIYLSRF
jgi:peptidyl-Asp metalloendopeptidase